MARQKRQPVDDTPICDPAYVRRINPVWMPGPVPQYFWEDRAHRRDYLLWLADRLGFRSVADFYRLELSACFRSKKHRGRGLIRYWHESALEALEDCFPEYDWKPWLFRMIPLEFWDSPVNRRSYLDWLGDALGFRRPEDWYRIRAHDISRCDIALLRRYASYYDLMREYLPQLDWDRRDKKRPIDVEDILAWADAHHSRHGKWPIVGSGKIPGTQHTWNGIDDGLRNGFRGLRGGISLAGLLQKYRGVRPYRGPKLSENKILRWADAHFRALGKWPTKSSGRVARTDGAGPRSRTPYAWAFAAFHPASRWPNCWPDGGKRNHVRLPPLTKEQILAWADAYFATHGKWPSQLSGAIPGTGESWTGIDHVLGRGRRGFPGGSSLRQFLGHWRGARNKQRLPPLTAKKFWRGPTRTTKQQVAGQIVAAGQSHSRPETRGWPLNKL